jgi:hypothetical protein
VHRPPGGQDRPPGSQDGPGVVGWEA